MTRRQFIAACLMLLVAVCLLDLERLREWWASVGGDEIRRVTETVDTDPYEFRLGAYPMLSFNRPAYIIV